MAYVTHKYKKDAMNYIGLASIFLVDQVIFRIVNPPFTVPHFRIPFNIIKYVGGTIAFRNIMI